MKKTKLLTTLGAVALIGAIGAGSTLAYLTDTTETVTNTFTVGNVSFDDEFGSGLRESKVERDENTGLYVDVDDAEDGTELRTVTENTYANLAAHEVVYKDPTVYMGENSLDAYLFVRIYNTSDLAFEDIDINGENWSTIGEGRDEAGAYLDYVYNDAVKANGEYTIFEHVTMGNLGNGQDIPQIIIKASAVQYSGFDDAKDAYAVAKWN